MILASWRLCLCGIVMVFCGAGIGHAFGPETTNWSNVIRYKKELEGILYETYKESYGSGNASINDLNLRFVDILRRNLPRSKTYPGASRVTLSNGYFDFKSYSTVTSLTNQDYKDRGISIKYNFEPQTLEPQGIIITSNSGYVHMANDGGKWFFKRAILKHVRPSNKVVMVEGQSIFGGGDVSPEYLGSIFDKDYFRKRMSQPSLLMEQYVIKVFSSVDLQEYLVGMASGH